MINAIHYEKVISERDLLHALEDFGKSLPIITEEQATHVDFGQIELTVKHDFSLGIYARTLYIPKGTVVVGKLHKYPQLNILAKGELSVSVENEIRRIDAVKIISSPAGTKRVAYAHEDSIWITIHHTFETDLEEIERHFIAQTEQEYLEFINANQLVLPL